MTKKVEVALAKLEEKLNSIEDLAENHGEITKSIDLRLRKIEDWRFYLLGWTTAISFLITFIWRKMFDA
jgi:hypothetical protein